MSRDLQRRVRKIDTDRSVSGATRYEVSSVPFDQTPTAGDDDLRELTCEEWKAKFCAAV